MSRIQKGYEGRFRALLRRAGARRLDEGVRRLVERAGRLGNAQGLSSAEALSKVHQALATQASTRGECDPNGEVRFFCDAGLGGLARWLRAAGYEALWVPDIPDENLVQQAVKTESTVLTTDSIMMERRVFRDGVIPTLWLSPALTVEEQLDVVFREFGLRLRASRCMSCGGRLERRGKESLRERLPPRTYLWLNEFFECVGCGKLYWHGTHWQKIRKELEKAASGRGEP